jgi:hypothetical protein
MEPPRPFSVYSGTDRLGHVEPAGNEFAAFDADGASLGTFATAKNAADAVSFSNSGACHGR